MTSALAGGILSTDSYQLTMAQLYWRAGLADRPARFEHFFRSYPDYGTHQAGFCIAAGLGPFARWMTTTRATTADVEALRGHRSRTGEQLFADDFLGWFATIGFDGLRVEAVAEGRVVHPNTPITVVEGPLAAAQLLETPLLNQLNFPTLIATKAARVAEASLGRPVLEFGARRAATGGGADAASRAAIVGGAINTSNAAVGYQLALAPAGTHAHSMVQLFIAIGGGEADAFDHYADVYPDDCLLLVDTVDTLGSGIPNAIATFEKLRARGHRPLGIRLDSGDLAYLSVQSAIELDRAGFGDASIVLSSQLDEITIWQIMSQIAVEARRAGVDADSVIGRLVLGVGSRMATSEGAPSLDGVFKLVAVQDETGHVGQVGEDEAGDAGQAGEDEAGDAGQAGEDEAGDAGQVGEDQTGDAGQAGQQRHDKTGETGDAGQARHDETTRWVPAIKRSDTPAKVLNPGRKHLWRLYSAGGTAHADVLSTADETLTPGSDLTLYHHAESQISRRLPAARWSRAETLTAVVVDGGEIVADGGAAGLDDLAAIAARRTADVEALDPGVRRLVNPHHYHVSITPELRRLKLELLDHLDD